MGLLVFFAIILLVLAKIFSMAFTLNLILAIWIIIWIIGCIACVLVGVVNIKDDLINSLYAFGVALICVVILYFTFKLVGM